MLITAAIVCLAAVARLPHMTGPIDEPHAWRQCDTAYCIDSYHANGIDLLRPPVCWMGDAEVILPEFPRQGIAKDRQRKHLDDEAIQAPGPTKAVELTASSTIS